MYYVDKLGQLIQNSKVKLSSWKSKKEKKPWDTIKKEIEEEDQKWVKGPEEYPRYEKYKKGEKRPTEKWEPSPERKAHPNGIFCPGCGKYSGLDSPIWMVFYEDVVCSNCGCVVVRVNNYRC